MLEALIGVLGVAFFGALGWAVQLSNRVATVETQQDDIVTLLNARFDDVNKRLDRIEAAIYHNDRTQYAPNSK